MLYQESEEIKDILEDIKTIRATVERRGIQIAEDRQRISKLEEIVNALVIRLRQILTAEELEDEIRRLRENIAELKDYMNHELIGIEASVNSKLDELEKLIYSVQHDLEELSIEVNRLKGYQWSTKNLAEAIQRVVNTQRETISRMQREIEDIRKLATSSIHAVTSLKEQLKKQPPSP